MSIKLVIFDKDGTLMDFDSFWVTVSRCAVTKMLKMLGAPENLLEPLLESMGVVNGVTDIRGVLCWGTYRLMGEKMHETLCKSGYAFALEEVVRLTRDTHHECADLGIVQGACVEIKNVLDMLKAQGRDLCVVTTDGPAVTKKCLDALEIADCFLEIFTADAGYPSKPDPFAIGEICRKYGLSKEEIVMVGDTLTDADFARNGGIRMIGVAKTQTNRDILAKHCDCVVPDISHVSRVLADWEA